MSMTLFDLTGRRALVSGASRGLGLQMAGALARAGADLVIALTHLDHDQNKALLSGSANEGPDLVLGGQPQQGESLEVGGRWILKGQADATAVRVAWVTVALDGTVSVQHERVLLGPETPLEDPALSMAANAWWRAFDAVLPFPSCIFYSYR